MSGWKDGETGILLKKGCRVKLRKMGWDRGDDKTRGVGALVGRQKHKVKLDLET